MDRGRPGKDASLLAYRVVFDEMGAISSSHKGGRMVSTVSPDTGTTTYVYDAAGNLVSKTDANGVTVTYVYDALSRLTSMNFPAHGEQPAYGLNCFYDQRTNGKGHLTDIFDPIQTTVFNYNTRGRLEEKNVTIGANVFTLSQDLTPGGRVSHMEYPDGRTVDFERVGCACRATKVSTTFEGVTKVIAEQLTYRPFGENTGMNMGNGGRVNNVVDLDGRMTVSNPGSTLERTFAYDPLGHLKSITISGANAPLYLQNLYKRSYDYDALNRLTHAAGPFWKTTDFAYDDVGNRLTKNASGQAESYTYLSGSNRLSQITNGTTTSYTYDTNGNIAGIGTRSLVYNQDNRLIQVQEGANVLGQYGYNAFGQRVAKTAGGATTYYLYDFQGNLMAESDASGSIQSEYLYRGRIRLAMADQSTGALYFFHNDQLGTPQLMTDQNNTVVWEGTYEPFGLDDINTHSTITNNFRFVGQFYDSETGYHYNYHRYYDPKTGRYLTPDPIGLAGGINPYLYAGNDPINRVDPLGLFDWGYPFRYWGDFGGGAHDFWRNYRNMREVNTIGADKYFHCMANCQAARRGLGGWDASELISESRELFDEYVKGDPHSACEQDRAANRQGREGNRQKSCSEICSSLRPSGLDAKW